MGCVLQSVWNSLQALCPSLAQYSRAMLGCYLKLSQRTPSLWSRARAHWSTLQNTTTVWLFLFLPTEDRGMMEGRDGGRRGGREAFSLAFFGMPFFASFPSRPSVSCLQLDTSAQLGSSTLEVCACVWTLVEFMISCYSNTSSYIYAGTYWLMCSHVIQMWHRRSIWEPLTCVSLIHMECAQWLMWCGNALFFVSACLKSCRYTVFTLS